MLFYGPPGTGKTSTIMAFSREYYGQYYRNMILELNGSDERGINVIRSQIKNFARIRNIHDSSKPKLVILDEADSLTNDAQFALRRVIEKYTSNVRFCLLCNYIKKLIDALQSRCLVFRFTAIPLAPLIKRTTSILQEECSTMPAAKNIELVCKLSNGDFRKILNFMETQIWDEEFISNYFFGISTSELEYFRSLLFSIPLADYPKLITIFQKVSLPVCYQIFSHLALEERRYRFLGQLSQQIRLYSECDSKWSPIFVYGLLQILISHQRPPA